ncbi:MAG: hypothetical protein KAJ72_02785 [Candidatus Heimdallarchaeota archaeon]|nr:hypothetical protein [Candidatus Heimdallarchaeota archaeon]
MSSEKEKAIAEQLLSLIDKKNVWELEILSSIINVNSQALTDFIKTLPMAFGLAVSGKKVFITPELVRDVTAEIKETFVSWYQSTGPRTYTQSSLLSKEIIREDFARNLRLEKKAKVKITVYGENFLVQRVIDTYLIRGNVQTTYNYEGGYEPINAEKTIGNDIVECQFSVINYSREITSLANLLFELSEGFLLVFNPLDKMQVLKATNIIQLLSQKRRSDLFVTFLGIITEEEGKESINEIASVLSNMVGQLETIPQFKVSFAILSDEYQIERKINDLLQTSQLLVNKD